VVINHAFHEGDLELRGSFIRRGVVSRSGRIVLVVWFLRVSILILSSFWLSLGDRPLEPRQPISQYSKSRYPPSHLCACHPLAAFGAASARLRTSLHLGVITHLLATRRALLTYLSANTACARVQIRSEQHKVGARLADFSAGEQQLNVARLRMLAAHLQAVRNCLQTDAVTAQTLVDALLHLVGGS
jgi:hypothetical protein